ncbi:hypothetical protein G7Z17_g2170 [Cylindrodendrum hubeiense]|uniref:Apple domain-containing protein n=1 Tax=Cylindrodendrum hubeiense TaxID=595255 RepID=A0A9P5HJG0_9HYPO|nr:hypothetical protein G7Z17_g2170 [Cylindrodendrum hubeiense]
MGSFKTLATIAVFSLGGVEATLPKTTLATSVRLASETTTSNDATAATLVARADGVSCFADYQGMKDTCNKQGIISNVPDPLLGFGEISFEDCASRCADRSDCNMFSYHETFCTAFTQSLSEMGFQEGPADGFWFEPSCFSCSHSESVVTTVDFENQDVSGWEITGAEGVINIDVQSPVKLGVPTAALRISETQVSGYGRVDLSNSFDLEERESYIIGVSSKSTSFMGPMSNPWGAVTFAIEVDGTQVFKSTPSIGSPIGKTGWGQWSQLFEVPEGLSGPATIWIGVQSDGYQWEYYFDDITVVKL